MLVYYQFNTCNVLYHHLLSLARVNARVRMCVGVYMYAGMPRCLSVSLSRVCVCVCVCVCARVCMRA